MPSARHSVSIDRPIDEVFAFFTDPSNEFQWRSQVKDITAEGPAAVGRRVHQVVKGPAGLSIPAHIEVTGYEPTTRYAFRGIAGPVRPVGEFVFSPDGERTMVSFSLSAELAGIKRLLMSRAVQRAMDGEVHAIEQAKVILERS
ncbi:SRPBCC family protein [Nocardioides sp. NPDC126508]